MDRANSRRQAVTRNRVAIEGIVTRACGRRDAVRVEDLSIDGCQLRGFFTPGDRLDIELPRIGRFAASVRWAAGGRAGLRFERRAGR